MQIRTNIVSCHTANSKPVKPEVNGTVILPPLVFPALSFPCQLISRCQHFIPFFACLARSLNKLLNVAFCCNSALSPFRSEASSRFVYTLDFVRFRRLVRSVKSHCEIGRVNEPLAILIQCKTTRLNCKSLTKTFLGANLIKNFTRVV